MPTLYIVATPIGNLEDITLRALRVLAEVELIVAEDTRVTRKLLSRHGIRTRLTSYGEHNKTSKLPSLLRELAERDLALVSDAGMPGINDPGQELVSAALKAGFDVVPVPGPSALTTAIAVSGLPVDQFIYLGFLPRRRVERVSLLEGLSGQPRALVVLETPHRLKASLEDALAALGDRRVAVCRELTKLYEEVFRGSISGALAYFERPRGEYTLVFEGAEARDEAGARGEARALVAQMREEGVSARDAVARVMALTGLTRREAYAMWLEAQPSDAG